MIDKSSIGYKLQLNLKKQTLFLFTLLISLFLGCNNDDGVDADADADNNDNPSNLLENFKLLGQSINGTEEFNLARSYINLSGDGKTLVISAHSASNQADNRVGYARVYELMGEQWVQKGTDITEYNISSHNTINKDGSIIATISSKTTSKPSSVHIYKFEKNDWVNIGNIDLNFNGASIDLNSSGTVIAISSTASLGTNNTEKIQVYQFNGTNWDRKGNPINDNDLGFTVSLDDAGNTLTAGENNLYSINIGHLSTYTFSNNSWVLRSSTPGIKNDFVNSVSISSDGNVLTSNLFDKETSELTVYTYENQSFIEEKISIEASALISGDIRNVKLSKSGKVLIVGPLWVKDSAQNKNKEIVAYIKNDNNIWSETWDLNGTSSLFPNSFGNQVVVSDDGYTVAVTSGEDGEITQNLGQISIYTVNKDLLK
ncbi:hypothetical protein [Flavivirga eckloniae]|uniref:Bulb-type lectin domain-containing protein n=1 Tax=Flavivirga eckloniae TaxID=1803846 RepID=A0A2K9PNA0_9FLAO|nr:hypothetical protein [Flavivirga eckloniae]AUP78543.1 hypothetical protein C1H87_07390 [Flavivirga eckloniae]